VNDAPKTGCKRVRCVGGLIAYD